MQEHTVRKSIFIVDDNPINLSVLYNYLVKLDFEVSVFQSGRDAIEEAKKDPPGLVLLDVRMPDIDGFETCRTLKQHRVTSEIPVIFMSALSDTINKIRAFEAGGVDYITKPFHQEEVLSRVKAHLSIRQQKEELSVESESKDYLFSIFLQTLEDKLENILSTDNSIKNSNGTGKLLNEKIQELSYFVKEVDRRYGGTAALQQSYPVNLNVSSSLSEIKNNLADELDKKCVKLEINTEPELICYGDPSLFKKAFLNMLLNFILLCPEGGTISVNTDHYQERKIRIDIGIKGLTLENTDPDTLFSLDGLISLGKMIKIDGYGYGLITAKAMITTMEGSFEIKTDNSGSTRVSVYLPAGLE